jgi:Cft2 family RNA processing exonuclease
MFHYDDGLRITSIDLGVDVRRRQARGFISHAHADHMARHELAFCTPATAALYQRRYGVRPTRAMPFGEPLQLGELTLTALPAGHVLGSAMLHVRGPEGTVLYTGDFRLRASATAQRCELPRADVLIMESTYGDPKHRFPPREEAIGQLLAVVRTVLAADRTPVVHAYVLGKAQEVTRILSSAGLRVVQHPLVLAISEVYRQLGCDLGPLEVCGESVPPDAVVVAPPRIRGAEMLSRLRRPVSIAVTGWAVDPAWRWRQGADYAIPLSDHADFDELVECVERVDPAAVYCTHGPRAFASLLRQRGHNAWLLAECGSGRVHGLCGR